MADPLKGLDEVLDEMNKQIEAIDGRTMKGLIRAGIIVHRAVDKDSPKIPTDTGNLRASRFTVTSEGTVKAGQSPNFKGEDTGDMTSEHKAMVDAAAHTAKAVANGPGLAFGYTANYAASTHENLEATFRRPGAGPKYLQAKLDDKQDEILKVIAKEVEFK